jgi:hypothetical protein
MTLAELIPEVQHLSAPEKLKLIRVLAGDLDTGADISPFISGKVYDIFTPYASPGAGSALMNALESSEADQG